MQLRFDAHQDFQVAAVNAVADLFEGQPFITPDLSFSLGAGFAAVGNRLDIGEAGLLHALREVQAREGIDLSPSLATIEAEADLADGPATVAFPNITVEMETGTGKTYVYARTALELFSRHGYRKFIVVVPSVAVCEGVLKTFRITERHFAALYANVPYRYYAYDSANLSQVRQFALSDSVEFMVMTLDSFNKAGNLIRQGTDHLQGEVPLHLIQATRPILILDEPQNMESEKSVAALATLDPLLALRYSATHRKPYNLVYRLTPFDAYRQGLVKRIEVASIVQDDDFNRAYIRLVEIKATKTAVTARVEAHVQQKSGAVKEKIITVKPGDFLRDKTEHGAYGDLCVDEINRSTGSITFTDGRELRAGEAQGADKRAVRGPNPLHHRGASAEAGAPARARPEGPVPLLHRPRRQLRRRRAHPRDLRPGLR